MKKISFLLVILLTSAAIYAQTWPASLAGRWTFDNNANLLEATLGSDLVLTGTHTAVAGPTAGDSAVAIDVGSYYTCTHGIPANGGGTLVNEYSIMFDIMIDNPKEYHCLYQTNQANSNDGEVFINEFSQIGITGTGYSGFSLKAFNWYRIVVTVDLGSSLRYYVDGKLVLNGISQLVDGNYSLDPSVLFFADENGEDNMIYVAQLAIFNSCLTAEEVYGLGGFRSSNITPYLQSPSSTSMYISWNSYETGTSVVQYEDTGGIGASATGSHEDIGLLTNINRWHTVKLSGLEPDTRYYYQCISGVDTSAVYAFRTPPLPGTSGRHIRFAKVGDSQTNTLVSTGVFDSIAKIYKQSYGPDWYDSVNLLMHSGDILESGSDLGRYMNEFFNPLSSLSPYIPTMISIGNHEGENGYYYQFMKYEDLGGFSERYYSFNLGNCQFISMNTNGLYNFFLQTNWLTDQLNASAADPGIDFVFTYNHQPGLSEVWPDGNTAYVWDNLYSVEASNPKMVMSTHGHSHNFERGVIQGTHGENWGFYSVLSGGAGGGLDRWGMYDNQTNYAHIQKSMDHYNFLMADIDMSAQTVFSTTYSLGHPDLPRSLNIIDKWHRIQNQPPPDKPDAIWPEIQCLSEPTLTAAAFSGLDTLMSSHFQLADAGGDFSSLLVDVIRDTEDYYGDSGSPLYNPINLNQGIDLTTYTIEPGVLTIGQSYMWRMRYRDMNLRWSDWSDTLQFTVSDVGIEETAINKSVTVYPNPANNHLYCKINNDNCNSAAIVITNILGVRLIEKHISTSNAPVVIDIHELKPGIYIYDVINEAGNSMGKGRFIINR